MIARQTLPTLRSTSQMLVSNFAIRGLPQDANLYVDSGQVQKAVSLNPSVLHFLKLVLIVVYRVWVTEFGAPGGTPEQQSDCMGIPLL
jgi:hypothetical protein